MPAFETTVTLPDQRSVLVNYKIFGDQSSNAPIGAVFANDLGCPPETTELPAEALAEQGFRVVTLEPDPTTRLTTRDRVHIMGNLGRGVLGQFVAMGFGVGGDVATRVSYEDYSSAAFDVAGLVDTAGSHEGSDYFLVSRVAQLPEAVFTDVNGLALPLYLDVLASSTNQGVRDYGAHIAKMTPAELAAYHFGVRDSLREAIEEGGSLDQLLLYFGGPVHYIYPTGKRASYLEDIRWQNQIHVTEILDSGYFMHADAPAAYVGALAEALIEVNGH